MPNATPLNGRFITQAQKTRDQKGVGVSSPLHPQDWIKKLMSSRNPESWFCL